MGSRRRIAACRRPHRCATQCHDPVRDNVEGSVGVDDHTSRGKVLPAGLQLHDEFLLSASSAPSPFVRGTFIEPVRERRCVYLEDEDAVEDVDEGTDVAGAAAEERDGCSSVSSECSHLFLLPQVMFVCSRAGDPWNRQPRRGVPLISKFAVAVDGLISALCQFVADCGFARSGPALDEEVSFAHRK